MQFLFEFIWQHACAKSTLCWDHCLAAHLSGLWLWLLSTVTMLSSRVCRRNHCQMEVLFCVSSEFGPSHSYDTLIIIKWCQQFWWNSIFFLQIWTLAPMFGWNRYVPEGNMTACGTDYLSKDWKSRSYILVYSFFVYTSPLLLIIYSYFFIVQVSAEEHLCLIFFIFSPFLRMVFLQFFLFTGCLSSRKEHARTSQKNERCFIAFSRSSTNLSWMPVNILNEMMKEKKMNSFKQIFFFFE